MTSRKTKKTIATPRRTRGKDTMTINEMAFESGLSRGTVLAAVLAGEMPHRKVGPRYIVARVNYQRWIGNFGSGKASAA